MAGARITVALLAMLGLAACAAPMTPPEAPGPRPAVSAFDSPEAAARNFIAVADRVMPVATALCRERTRNVPCDFQIAVDDRLDEPPNAFQTLDAAGRPVLVFTVRLIAEVDNADEMAFVMGHEASHHIAGHIPRQQESAMTGALVAGTIASLGGGSESAVRAAQDFGAEIGSRSFSQDFELEADALGTEIAWRAGFDPLVGAEFFRRIPDPGSTFLGSHPPNARRLEVVRATVAALQ